MIEGAMKIPEPIIEPTTSVVAEKKPSRRTSVGRPAAATGRCGGASKLRTRLRAG
ncbi:MAG TPA: hypothetical protein VGM06_03730 [Polyangiaceae bacterium]|jgi:hypothetical protein